MPRPRIRIEDRQRAVKACIPCKSSKKRCDSKIPCSPCIRRGSEQVCVYAEGRQKTWRTSHKASQLDEDTESSRSSKSMGFSAHHGSLGNDDAPRPVQNQNDGPSVEDPSFSASADDDYAFNCTQDGEGVIDASIGCEAGTDSLNTDPATREENTGPRSRLLLNSKGEKVYVGSAAALAFLQFLRQILTKHMGPSHFTENRLGNIMLEAHISGEELPDIEEDVEQKRVLVDNFFLASSGILDLYTRSEVYELLTDMNTMNESKGLLYLVFAIGGQCRISSPRSLKSSQRYFTHGQRIAFEGMLEDPSIRLIHSFLLMAFYLLGACRRNAAFMYLGIAARAAHALGLHDADQYSALSRSEKSLRLRTWKSLRILDVMNSSILARPLASLSTRPDIAIANLNGDDPTIAKTSTNANFEICSIIEEVLQYISQQTTLDFESTQALLQKLSTWSATNLSLEMRIYSVGASIGSSEHEKVLGNIHTACLYYFTVMLLTRPFLIRYLMSRLSSKPSSGMNIGASAEPANLSDLAQVSIDVAVYMAQTCQNAMSAGLIIGNMCILKAWLFAAGLVLGFTLFANIEVSSEVENAFTGVRGVLKKLSHQSPQAEHYHDVLSSFSEAIIKRQKQIAQERRRATSQYVDRILVL
ncbi:putative C6 transcription factor, partial [Rhexocercosporidium sp. MPI-PUGE-AT-0058]